MKTENKQATATARPWQAKGVPLKTIIFHSDGSAYQPVAKMLPEHDGNGGLEQEANAALIVRAVNEYDALNAVAKAADDLQDHFRMCGSKEEYLNLDNRLNAALGKLASIRKTA